jgi:hypothetical protein
MAEKDFLLLSLLSFHWQNERQQSEAILYGTTVVRLCDCLGNSANQIRSTDAEDERGKRKQMNGSKQPRSLAGMLGSLFAIRRYFNLPAFRKRLAA